MNRVVDATQGSAGAIVVLGMHRSGTSALTGILRLLGVELGADLMPPAEDNQRGFWEHVTLVEMNERLLDVLNSRWDDLLLGQGCWWERPELRPVKELIRERLRRDFSSYPLWAFKDPRMCRLLPAWREAFEQLHIRPLFVHMLRHPLEVARSLERRDGMPRVQALLLWLLHVLEAEQYSRGEPRTFVTYEGLLAHWSNVIEDVRRALAIRWPLDPGRQTDEVERFLSRELRHERAEQAEEGLSRFAEYWLTQAEAVYGFLSVHGDAEVAEAPLLSDLGRELEELLIAPNRQLSGATSRLWACHERLQPLEAAQTRLEAKLTQPPWLGFGLSATRPAQTCALEPLSSGAQHDAEEPRILAERKAILDVVIPVYGGVSETHDCLHALFDSGLDDRVEVVVVNDASPYPELVAWLRELAEAGRIQLLQHEQNQGFAAAVNTGIGLHPERDVLLLNSDTQVPKGWYDRLMTAAYREISIGTVTPFSNNASICSYPRMLVHNLLPQGWTLEAMDELFRRANSGAMAEIPIAVGFCMLIKRVCLNDTGFFDASAFRSGYGEEDEFCMRARERGWRHVIAADTFVYHKGSVSFANTDHLQREARQRLDRLHPEYAAITRAFILADPLRPYRYKVDWLRAESRHEDALALLHERHGHLAECRWDLEAMAQRYRELDQHSREVTRERDAYAPQLDVLAVELERLRTEVRGLEVSRAEVIELLQATSSERDAYAERLQAMVIENGRLRDRISQLERELETIYSSRSWRYTAPLRRWLGH